MRLRCGHVRGGLHFWGVFDTHHGGRACGWHVAGLHNAISGMRRRSCGAVPHGGVVVRAWMLELVVRLVLADVLALVVWAVWLVAVRAS